MSTHNPSHDNSASQPAARPRPSLHEWFHRFAAYAAHASGSPWTFAAAVFFLLLWACSYPLFLGFQDALNTWQLVVNTATTIVTFLMVFLIQNTQNRDAKAIHLKLDELIRAHKGARNRLVELENCTDEELEILHDEFQRVRSRAATRHESAPNHHRPDSTPVHAAIKEGDCGTRIEHPPMGHEAAE